MSAYHAAVTPQPDGDEEALLTVQTDRGPRTRVAIVGHAATVQELLHGLRVVGHHVDVTRARADRRDR